MLVAKRTNEDKVDSQHDTLLMRKSVSRRFVSRIDYQTVTASSRDPRIDPTRGKLTPCFSDVARFERSSRYECDRLLTANYKQRRDRIPRSSHLHPYYTVYQACNFYTLFLSFFFNTAHVLKVILDFRIFIL